MLNPEFETQDNGRTVWYFSAPEKYLGEKGFAHNGKLSFRLGTSPRVTQAPSVKLRTAFRSHLLYMGVFARTQSCQEVLATTCKLCAAFDAASACL